MPGLQYTALEKDKREIRLLTVHPRRPNALYTPQHYNGLLSFTMTVVSLNEPPQYTALSYVWGDASNKKQAVVDGSVIDVTANLEAALRHLDQEPEPVVLWVDAVWINQEDIHERNEQVQL